jgi:hypothetical protein
MVTQKHAPKNGESMGWKIGAGIATALAGATIGLVVNFVEQRRANELQFVSSQIERLYGPLFALREASGLTFVHWHKFYWPDREKYFDPNYQIKPKDIELRRRWMKEVFQPINVRMEEVLVNNSHLLIGQRMPPMFLQFISHTEAYKAVMAKWELNSSSTDPEYLSEAANVSIVAYPPRLTDPDNPDRLDFSSCIKQQYDALRHLQDALRRNIWTVLWATPPTIPTVCGSTESTANSKVSM